MTVAPREKGSAIDVRFSKPRILLFGIGAQKAGTSWLANYFGEHSEVHMSPRKELHYWNAVRAPRDRFPLARRDKELRRLKNLRGEFSSAGMASQGLLSREIEDLEAQSSIYDNRAEPFSSYADALFQRYFHQPIVCEMTPAYARLESDTFGEMAALGRDVRFLFQMRDPVARLISGIRHSLRRKIGYENVTSATVEERLVDVLSRSNGSILEKSQYDMTVRRLEAVVPNDQIFYTFFETMFAQPEIDRLCDFLGIGRRPAKINTHVHVGGDRSGAVRPELLKQARDKLSPVYEFVSSRFGALPKEWMGETEARSDGR